MADGAEFETMFEADGEAGQAEAGALLPLPPTPHPEQRPEVNATAKSKKRKQRAGFLAPRMRRMNQRFEQKCRKVLDRIYGQAKTQGETTWLAEQKADDAKVKKMLDHYRKIIASAEDTKKARFMVAQYTEVYKTEQGVENIDAGKMMWEDKAIDYWKTTPGGALGADEAKAKWDDMAANYKERKMSMDMGGPNPKKPMQLRVFMGKHVNFKNAATIEKHIERAEASIKNRLRKSGTMGTGASSSEMQNVAIGMVSSGSGQAFSQVGMQLPDVTVLGRRDDDEDADFKEDPMDAAAGNKGGKGGNKRPRGGTGGRDEVEPKTARAVVGKPKAKWVDIAGEVNAARRTLRTQMNTAQSSTNDLHSKLKASNDDINSMDEAKKKLFRGVLALAQVRFQAIGHAQPAPGPQASPEKAAADGASSELASQQLGQMPPCGSQNFVDELDGASSIDGIKEITNIFQTNKAPTTDLINCCNKALNDIARAKKTIDKKSSMASQQAAVPVKLESATVELFEIAPQIGQEITAFPVAADGVDFSAPFIVGVSQNKEAFEKIDVVTAQITHFTKLVAKFEQKIRKEKDGRTSCKVPESAQSSVREYAKTCIKDIIVDSAAPEKVRGGMAPNIFAVMFGVGSFGTEKEFLPSLRFGISGARKIAVTELPTLAAFMESQKVDIAKLQMPDFNSYRRGFIFAVRVAGQASLGFRAGAADPDDKGVERLKKIKVSKEKAGKDASCQNEWITALTPQDELAGGICQGLGSDRTLERQRYFPPRVAVPAASSPRSPGGPPARPQRADAAARGGGQPEPEALALAPPSSLLVAQAPVAERVVRSLKTVRWRGRRRASSGPYEAATSDCAVCLEAFAEGELLPQLPACRHLFHRGCLEPWLARRGSCPRCRAPVDAALDAAQQAAEDGARALAAE
ncbi:unnamed protein product [Prorocentrum cordatum]|uniref:RING-type domain-containing protein n=1 Tax=Prorocentrum cordatum TaxID=2364126 RepID=A0ABN9WZD3_9DINO|nr:unnamed protein product [Polarella glacialis]